MIILAGVGKVILTISITLFILSIAALIALILLKSRHAKAQGYTAASNTLPSKRDHDLRLLIGKRSWSKRRHLFERERFVSPEVLRSGNATTADWIMAVAVTSALVSFASIFLGIGFLFAPVGLVFSIVGIFWVVPILRAMWTDWKKAKKK